MLSYYILSAWSLILDQADHFLLTCPFKYLTGLDCPGCGFQRSLLALLKGDWAASFHLYPPTVPILVTVLVALASNYGPWPKNPLLIKVFYLITGSIILISYIFKVSSGHIHGVA